MSLLRKILCWAMAGLLPVPLFAADIGAAMLYAQGTVWVNGAETADSAAVFPGDLVQTKPDSQANINALGSNVMIGSDSLVRFEANGISLQHGSLNVVTSKGLSSRSGDIVVAPAAGSESQYTFNSESGGLHVVAQRGNLTISEGSEISSLSQRQETTVPEAQPPQKKKKRAAGAVPGAGGPWLNARLAILAGTAAAAGILTWVLIQGDDPMSNANPRGASGTARPKHRP